MKVHENAVVSEKVTNNNRLAYFSDNEMPWKISAQTEIKRKRSVAVSGNHGLVYNQELIV